MIRYSLDFTELLGTAASNQSFVGVIIKSMKWHKAKHQSKRNGSYSEKNLFLFCLPQITSL